MTSPRRRPRLETGYTLIELIVTLTILAAISGAVTGAFLTANNANANVSDRLHQSNDAQLTAGFWTADAQAAGGVDPSQGTRDTALGVLATTDNGGCNVGSATKIIGFKWKEWASRDAAGADSFTTRVAYYVHVASTHELQRITCANGAAKGTVTLATRVAGPPTTSCYPAANCPGMPRTVSISVAESGQSAYSFDLTATVRSDNETPPDATNSTGSPLMVMAGSCTTGAGFAFGGSSDIVVNGGVVISVTDGAACHAVSVNGNGNTYDVASTTIANGGTCSGSCGFGWSNGMALGNPFANLPAPSTAGCGGGTNPTPVNGHWPATTYPQTVTLAAGQVFDPGTVVLCNGLAGGSATRSTGVFIYVAGGTITASTVFLSAPTTGVYAHVAMWNATTNDWNVHQDTVNIEGAYYSPNAGLINGNGITSVTIGVLIVKFLSFSGSSDVTVTGTGTPGSPTLTAVTSPNVLRQVDLTWVAPTFTGISAITDYQLRANRGTGWSAWASVGLAQPVHDVCGSNPAVAQSCDYQIRAVNAQGPGSPSNIANALSLADGVAPMVTVTAPAAPVGLSTTLSGAAGNVTGDSATVNVALFDNATCTGLPSHTYPVARTGATWSVASGALTPGTKCVQATQSDTAGNVGSASLLFAAGLQVANGGTLGRADRGDTISVVYPRTVNESTLCNTWTTNTNQSIVGNNVVTVTITDGGAGNDVLTVSTSSGCTFNFGSIGLGSASWVNATTTYKGTGGNISRLDFTAATNTLKITLGTGTGSGTAVAASTMTYTPPAAIKDTGGGSFVADYAGQTFINERF